VANCLCWVFLARANASASILNGTKLALRAIRSHGQLVQLRARADLTGGADVISFQSTPRHL
jgi:hypothetical protein